MSNHEGKRDSAINCGSYCKELVDAGNVFLELKLFRGLLGHIEGFRIFWQQLS